MDHLVALHTAGLAAPRATGLLPFPSTVERD